MATKPKYLEITPEDLERVNQTRSKHEGVKIDPEQLFVAEFGKHYGWGGVRALLDNEIDGETAVWLMQAARKVDYRRLHDSAQATLIGTGTAQTKKPSDNFKRATREIVRAMRADI